MSQRAERGMGIAVRALLANGRLLQVLPEWAAARLRSHAVLASPMQPASVCALLGFLAARLMVV